MPTLPGWAGCPLKVGRSGPGSAGVLAGPLRSACKASRLKWIPLSRLSLGQPQLAGEFGGNGGHVLVAVDQASIPQLRGGGDQRVYEG